MKVGTRFKIFEDGSVYVDNEFPLSIVHIHRYIEALDQLGRDAEDLDAPHAIYPTGLKIGCKTFTSEELAEFLEAYASGKWKKPESIMVKVGSIVRHEDNRFVVAKVKNKILLINVESGYCWNWDRAVEFEPIDFELVKLTGERYYPQFTLEKF